MKKRTGYNPKRKIAPPNHCPEEQRAKWVANAKYGGNPEHKKRPADYDLTPPASPRPGKTLCDAERPLMKPEAEGLLREGFRKGMISQRTDNTWPQNVWAVSDGQAFEAQLENSAQGVYHGYPMPLDDDFRTVVMDEWSKR
jgi:hypothetical protein